MTKSDIPEMPQFFDRYIAIAPAIDVISALQLAPSFNDLIPFGTADALGDLIYAPGKWTMRDIVQHIIDTERIMAYRALRLARQDKTPLPGFDEEAFGQTARAGRRSLSDLYDEYALNRQSTLALFQSFDEDMFVSPGICSNISITPLALGYVLVGHPMHHANVIRERYLPLLDQ